jgi:flagellar motor switch protein FliG
MAIQKVLRDVDSQELAVSLKDQDEAVKEKIFSNMSQRACATLKEDMEHMGPVRMENARESQKKILSIIHYYVDCGEIIIGL